MVRVAVERADLDHGSALDDLHHLIRAADRTGGKARAEHVFASVTGSRLDAKALGRAAGRDAEARLDLVEDENDAVSGRDLADRLEIAGLWEHDPEVHHRRLHDHAGGRRPSASRRTRRRSSASESLNGTATVRSATCCGTPAPYGNDGMSSVEVAPVDADAHGHHHPS
jgi:hypothetical protein